MGNKTSSIPVAEGVVYRTVLDQDDSSCVARPESDINPHNPNGAEHPRNRLTLGWYQKEGFIGHTGLVLSINGVKKFTFDLTGKSTGISKNTATGFIFHFKEKHYYKGDLCDLSLGDIPKFIDMCRECQQKMYHVTLANCRDFNINVANKLMKKGILPQEKFSHLFEEIQEIKQEDIKKKLPQEKFLDLYEQLPEIKQEDIKKKLPQEKFLDLYEQLLEIKQEDIKKSFLKKSFWIFTNNC